MGSDNRQDTTPGPRVWRFIANAELEPWSANGVCPQGSHTRIGKQVFAHKG